MKQNFDFQSWGGFFFGLAAFGMWGFLPAYWKQMQAIEPFEILCHRVLWSFIFLILVVSRQKKWHEMRDIIKTPTTWTGLVISGSLIGNNWFFYIWAVNSDCVVETSLGYYITPLISVLIGCIFFKEKLSRIQWICVSCALTGVLYSLAAYGVLPKFALVLAFSFGFYGFARKKSQAPAIPGLLFETSILLVPAAAYLLFRQSTGESLFLRDTPLTLWLMSTGVATSLPLLCFAEAAKRLNLSTIGILQYLAPSIAFMLGVFVYNEPFTRHTLVTFGFIWTGVILYAWNSVLNKKNSP